MGMDSSGRALPNGVFTVMGKSRPEDRTITKQQFLVHCIVKNKWPRYVWEIVSLVFKCRLKVNLNFVNHGHR